MVPNPAEAKFRWSPSEGVNMISVVNGSVSVVSTFGFLKGRINSAAVGKWLRRTRSLDVRWASETILI